MIAKPRTDMKKKKAKFEEEQVRVLPVLNELIITNFDDQCNELRYATKQRKIFC